ncbi:von Willebrand factor A domain-containing protein 7-like [Scyliorhinus canicula]|uniref:von Willebrand factor A domain-containing protein 7-like n=1 Tax=Scyliorhinus canicula TaxID=7830 RepID=UPI0018F61078|nr:von Willebrand factor A domain-containing protein 7-like [Scyliorhinus canicula]
MKNVILPGFAALLLLTSWKVLCFNPNFGDSITHSDITKEAALRIVLQLFRQVPNPDGKVFPSNIFQSRDQKFTAEELFEAYYGSKVSVSRFKQAVQVMMNRNTKVDFMYALEGKRHFDSETLQEGKEVLLTEKAKVIQNIMQRNYHQAQKHMGTLLHTLQDFYSHSNWIELGFQKPNSNLIKPGEPIGRVAGKTEQTCADCSASTGCQDEILDKVIKEKIITTGYFGFKPHSKPDGKCSHGGKADISRQGSQGINKDTRKSPHSQYHNEAARVATEASIEIFKDVWDTVDHKAFSRFLGVESSAGLSFVIDTTGSMRDDIEAAKERTINIVKNRRRAGTEPSFYILVPFSDPDFGPVFKTSDPDKFIDKLKELKADGGGDIPEMSLSALRLALTNTPPLSHIYVFTDAPAKDHELNDSILALIEQTKCKVSFLLTNAVSRRKRDVNDRFGNQLYRVLARVSGGLAVVIQRALISQLTSIIEDSATAALVTILQRENNPDYPSNLFIIHVDPTLQNITIYISGMPQSFRLSNPEGLQQPSTLSDGVLASMDRMGDLIIIRLHSPIDPGDWDLVVSSGIPYSVKVTGQSVVDFMYDFVEPFEGPHPGLTLLAGRPMAGTASIMSVTVTGLPHYTSLRLRNVALLNARGEVLRKEPLKSTSSPDIFLVEFETLPDDGFSVQLVGVGENSIEFHRQSPTIASVTKTRVKVNADPSVKVGSNANVSFTVTNAGPSSQYRIHVTDDQNFIQSEPMSLTIDNNQTVEGNSIISVPEVTEPGTVVTVTVEARSSLDFGYSILELTVVSRIQDLRPPICDVVGRISECPAEPLAQCSLQSWSLSAKFVSHGTDRVSIYARHGNGSLDREETQDGSQMVTLVTFKSSCCFPNVELVAVDKLGNVGKCSSRVRSRAPSLAARNAAILLVAALVACLVG